MPIRVLLLGGYGLFGRRLSQLLAAQGGANLLIAGRSLAAAQALANQLPGAQALECDASGADLPARLRELKPDVLVHLAGPFQGQDYRVAKACIAAGVHYIDLADGRDFVCGIGGLDEAARQAGVLVCSGASSVPALSCAATDRLAEGMGRVDEISIGISPGNRTERGLATVRAILGYCGRPLATEHGETVIGWGSTSRHRYPPPVGARLLSPCEVPDLTLLPARYPGRPVVRFGAGLELGFLHRGMNVLAALRRWGWVRDWGRHARVLHFLGDLFRRTGTDAGAMHVTVKGVDARGKVQQRSWQLLALQDDGPFVPALAAAALIRALSAGQLRHRGAQPCLGLLTLEQFEREAQGRAIKMGQALPLYQAVMGQDFEALAAAPRRFHSLQGRWRLRGEVKTQPSASLPARLLALLMRTPRTVSSGSIRFELDAASEEEHWLRNFPSQRMRSRLSPGPEGGIVEHLGAARLHFGLASLPDGSLSMKLLRLQFLGIPCPRWLMPRVVAEERGDGSRLHFRIRAEAPGLGLVASYEGWLDLDSAEPSPPPP